MSQIQQVSTDKAKPVYMLETSFKGAGLKFDELSKINLARCNEWHNINDWSLDQWLVATIGELGELANVVKKYNRLKGGIKSNNNLTFQEISDKMKEEIAGTFLYLDLFTQCAELKTSDCIIYEFNRVSNRESLPYIII